MTQPRTLTSIQYLRALAALAVAAFHTGWTHTDIGQAGVDLFFVISGFIMMHVSGREPSPGAFLRARAIRIVPLYWLATLLAAILAGTTDAGHLLASLLFLPHAGPDGRGWPVLVQGWTLNYEAFFYVAFALSLLLRAHVRLLAMTAGLGVLALAGLVLHPTDAILSTYTSPLLLEFLVGAWLCCLYQAGRLLRGSAAAVTLAIGVAALLLQIRAPYPESWRALAWGLPTALVLGGALGMEMGRWMPNVLSLCKLGDASYALYLMHILVLERVQPWVKPLATPLALSLAVLACVCVGWVTHRFVEQPCSQWISKRLHTRRSRGIPTASFRRT